LAHGLELIDWKAPWLAPYQATGQACCRAVVQGGSVAQAMQRVVPACPVRFVSQSALPEGEPYERFIFETQQVPTRDGLHDFFNGLVWVHFPQTKRQLNRLQAEALARDGIQPVRGPVRDAVTLFDESGLILQAPDALWEALCVRDWQRLLVRERGLWAQARATLLGHAVMEQLVHPRKNITARVLRVPLEWSPSDWDGRLAAWLSAERLASKPFQPLPVLGIPGWWPANEDLGFYDDVSVFRPRRVPASA
jgi:Protein of unknown function (DUF3025)